MADQQLAATRSSSNYPRKCSDSGGGEGLEAGGDGLAILHQPVPRTAQSVVYAQNRGQQNVDLAGLNFLNRPWIQASQFSQPLLSDRPAHPLPAHVRTESLELDCVLP